MACTVTATTSVIAIASCLAQTTPQDLETAVPANWAASAGSLSISPNHYKLGSKSLRWNWTGGDVITISNPGINAPDVLDYYKNTCDFWMWNGTAMPGEKLRVEFMDGGAAQYWFDFYLDYTGWRHAVRSYKYDMGKGVNPSSTFTSVRIIAPASGSGSFHLDAVRWVGDSFTRIRDAQNVDIAGFSSQTKVSDAYAHAPDIAATAPTQAELADLATLRSRWLATVKGSTAPSASSVVSAANSFAGMNIVEDGNGIRGQVIGQFIGADTDTLESWPLTLAKDYAFGTATANTSRDKMLQLGRHLQDQGHAANSNEYPADEGAKGYDYQNLPKALILMAPAYNAATKAQLFDFFCWNYKMGEYWSDDWRRNVDIIYLTAFQQLGVALFLAPNDTESVRMLKGYRSYLERYFSFADGSEDGIKVDGIGFHHRSHYNAYMYAYGPLAASLYNLRGTGFQVNLETYQNVRSAYLAKMRMSADDAGIGIGYFGNSLCGRHPFNTNTTFYQNHLRELGELGGPFYGQSADPVIARAYNRRYGVNHYALFTSYGVEDPPDGFLQFNYSPLGIYRRANWVASMR
ncbi:MAG TPA: chondroitinase family polysaccharide lyase, partial [Luteolibacter sp.]